MDIGLHGNLNGIKAAKEINCRFGIPVVFVSGFSENFAKERADLCGQFHFVSKPIDFYELEAILQGL